LAGLCSCLSPSCNVSTRCVFVVVSRAVLVFWYWNKVHVSLHQDRSTFEGFKLLREGQNLSQCQHESVNMMIVFL
jgi:hypothetical protein